MFPVSFPVLSSTCPRFLRPFLLALLTCIFTGCVLPDTAVAQLTPGSGPGHHGSWHSSHLRLHNQRARWFAPDQTIFLSRDPAPGSVTLPATFHPYTWGRNDPVNRTDPSGRTDFSLKSFLSATAISGTLSAMDAGIATRGAATRSQIAGAFLSGAAGGAVGYLTAPVFLAFGAGGRFALGSLGLAAASGSVAESLRQKNTLLAVYRGAVFGILTLATIHDPAIRVFRVEGEPNARILITSQGEVTIVGHRMLFLNFGQRHRAQEFLAQKQQQNMPGARIKSFTVPQSYLQDLRQRAVDESQAHAFPEAPIMVDLTKAPDQFGIRAYEFEPLIRSIHQGSGREE